MIDPVATEIAFAALLRDGWPPPRPPAPRRAPRNRLEQVGALVRAFELLAEQMVDSTVPETRAFWRARHGLPDEAAP